MILTVKNLLFRFIWIAAATTLLVALPVRALMVEISPESPQLGDTVTVIIETKPGQSNPTVFFKDQNFPVFPLPDSPHRYRALLPTNPLDKPGRWNIQVKNGTETSNLAIWLKDKSFPTQRLWFSESGGGLSATELELERVKNFKSLVTPEQYWSGSFLRPSPARVSALYGVRRYYNGVFAEDYYHRGVDYAGSLGSPIVAPAAGRVALIGREDEGFKIHGNTIGIDHGQGVVSIFLHLEKIQVQEGDFVQPGQTIGTIGNTGASTGPHLHWGLYVHGVSVDPVPWRFAVTD